MGRGRKDRSKITIKEELKVNPDDYDYMDTLPLEGWIWEFIRRNSEYKKMYIEFVRIAKREDYGAFFPRLRELRKNFTIRALILPIDGDLDSEHFFKVKMPRYELCASIPKPNIKYNQFKELKPITEGVTPVIPHKIEVFEKKKYEMAKGITVEIKDGYCVPKEYCDKAINEILPPVDVRDTLYVGVAMTANKDDIREALEGIIKHLIKPRLMPIRDEKWKPYLFVYDLKEMLTERYPKISYKNFTEILCDICPEFKIIKVARGRKKIIIVDSPDYFNEKNCENFYKAARRLIEGGYKKYLYLK